MRFTKTTTNEQLPYQVVKLQGCVDTNIGFELLASEPITSKRRYCNKILVHECVQADVSQPLALSKVEFAATSDPCYKVFEFFKSSDPEDDSDPSIELELNDDDEVVSLAVLFYEKETACAPIRFAYRLYGYLEDGGDKILLSQGTLYITPCVLSDAEREYWTDVAW